MQDRALDVEGIRVRWHEEGSGRTTLLIHGAPTSYRLWRHVVPRLEDARIVAWELVGYGQSMKDDVSADLSIAAQAEYVAAAMHAERMNSAVIVGHDIGGGIAQILAARHPSLVAGIVLVNSAAYGTPLTAPISRIHALRGIVRRAPRRLVRRLIRGAILRGHDVHSTGIESFDQHWAFYGAVDGGRAALYRQLRSLHPPGMAANVDELRRLALPARIVWGVSDPYRPIDDGRRLAIDLVAPLDPIDGARHFTPENHPDRVAASINSLLRELAQSRPKPVHRHSPATRSSGEARAR